MQSISAADLPSENHKNLIPNKRRNWVCQSQKLQTKHKKVQTKHKNTKKKIQLEFCVRQQKQNKQITFT